MVAVEWDDAAGHYWVMRRGDVISTHDKANRAKERGKREGRKYGEVVTYTGKRTNGTKTIYRPDPEEQFEGGTAGSPDSGGGLFGGLF